VLRLWAAKRENTGRDLTVREAQWVSRLYSVIKDMRRLAIYSSLYAREERLFKASDKSLDLSLFEAMTGQKIDSKRAEKILGHREFDPILFQRMLFGPKWVPSDKLPELVGIREMLRDIGGEQT